LILFNQNKILIDTCGQEKSKTKLNVLLNKSVKFSIEVGNVI